MCQNNSDDILNAGFCQGTCPVVLPSISNKSSCGGLMHLVIDGYGGDVDKMWDQDLVRGFLDQFPAKLSMTPKTGICQCRYFFM